MTIENFMKREKIPNPYKMKIIKGFVLTKEKAKNAKIRITTYLDEEVLDKLRAMAKKSGGKYQSTLNQVSRHYLLEEEQDLITRIEKLEKAVFKKRAA